MNRVVRDWLQRNTFDALDWPLSRVLDLKGETSVAVVVPARNEVGTIGHIVRRVATELPGLVDELVVMDSLSDDGTAEAAAVAGARVHGVARVRDDLGVHAGKGEALWKSLFVTRSEILVFLDGDLTDWGTHFVTGLVGPLLARPELALVRGFYDRISTGSAPTSGGGRVTEIFARPWLALHRPELAGVVQPLAGEWSIRRRAFEQLSIPRGYGVELSTLLDVHSEHGLEALGQVDLGRRGHRSQDLADLGVMAAELMVVAERRSSTQQADHARAEVPGGPWLAHRRADGRWTEAEVSTAERPPASAIADYPSVGFAAIAG